MCWVSLWQENLGRGGRVELSRISKPAGAAPIPHTGGSPARARTGRAAPKGDPRHGLDPAVLLPARQSEKHPQVRQTRAGTFRARLPVRVGDCAVTCRIVRERNQTWKSAIPRTQSANVARRQESVYRGHSGWEEGASAVMLMSFPELGAGQVCLVCQVRELYMYVFHLCFTSIKKKKKPTRWGILALKSPGCAPLLGLGRTRQETVVLFSQLTGSSLDLWLCRGPVSTELEHGDLP